MEEIKIKPNDVNWTFFSYSETQTRQFNCNEIVFIGLGIEAGSSVLINDVFSLLPLVPLYVRSGKNEIDRTVYKFTIIGSASVQGYYKMDAGVTADQQKELLAASKVPRPDRMRKSKEFYMKKGRK